MGQRAGDLVGREVRFGDIRLGVVVDVVFDLDAGRALGLEVRCGDDAHRFLPLGACDTGGGAVAVASPFVLLEAALYRERGRALGSLRGADVRAGAVLGRLVDVAIDSDAAVNHLVVATSAGRREIPLSADVAVGRSPLRPAV